MNDSGGVGMQRCMIAVLVVVFCGLSVQAGQPKPAVPPKPGPGFHQKLTPAISVESNVSKEHCEKLYQMVWKAEQKFYQLFKLNPELMNGVSKQKFDFKSNIPGTIMQDIGFRPYITLRVYKDYEGFAREWFELTGVTDKEKQLTQGVPGAYFSIHPDYDKTTMLRDIRSFVANRDDDELERTLLHEMGHLFMHSYLLEFQLGYGDRSAETRKGADAKVGTPAWLGEGCAQLFENLWSSAKSAEKNRKKDQAVIYEAIKLGDHYTFEEFTQVTNAHNLAAVADDPQKATINYAQSFSVMDYFVNVDGARFFTFLETLRAMNVERSFRGQPRNGFVQELYTIQNAAFRKAYNCDIKDAEKSWQAHVKKTTEKMLLAEPEMNYYIGEYYLRRRKDTKEQNYAKAEELFKLAMEKAPKKGEGYLGTGRMELRKGNSDEAEKLFSKAVELMPKDDDAWYYLGVAQTNTGKLKEAVESFQKALAIYSRNERAVAGLATAAFENKDYLKAAEAYEQAYQISHHPRLLFQKGQALFFGKDYRNAQSAFNAYTAVYAKDPQGQFWYGLSAFRLGDKEFGLKKMKEAQALAPNDGLIAEGVKRGEKGESLRFQREDDEPEKPVAAGDKNPPANGVAKDSGTRIGTVPAAGTAEESTSKKKKKQLIEDE